jgi:hypothetical protein
MGYPEPIRSRRPVHDALDELREVDAGYESWCDFIEHHDNFIPAVQLGSVRDEIRQFECFHGLGRGMVVIVEQPGFGGVRALSSRVSDATDGGEDVCFVLDYLRVSRDHLQRAAATAGIIDTILAEAPEAYISVSASSFPDNFVNVPEQQIYERRLFDAVMQAVDTDRMIYSDRGSARVERQQGGGGTPSPRIDYPMPRDWKFYRSEDSVGFRGYREQARRLMADAVWNGDLRVWGTQMIERTAAGDSSAISNPARSTAARINIHLQVQSFYDDPASAADTDEEWED